MKTIIPFVLFLLIFDTGFSQSIPADSLYLGQTLPGNNPKLFAPSFLSCNGYFNEITISSNGKAIYYTEMRKGSEDGIKYFSYYNNKWNGPFLFFKGFGGARLSRNDDTIFIQKGQWQPDSIQLAYYSTYNGKEWSKPKRFLKLTHCNLLQETNNCNYYCAGSPAVGSISKVDWCKIIFNNNDTIAVSLGRPLNGLGGGDFSVSKYDSFMIIAKGGQWVSFHKKDGTWTYPKWLGQVINFARGSWGSYLSPDSKYLFYSPASADDYSDARLYWVRIDNIIDSLKKTNYVPYMNNQIMSQTAEINRFFKYTIPDSTFIDDDGNTTLNYKATLEDGTSLPSWLSFNSQTKTFSGMPEKLETISILLTAIDNENVSISCKFKIEVMEK